MEISTVEMLEDGSFLVNKPIGEEDGVRMCVPDNMGNRHRVMIQEWIDKGNTPTPYVAPEQHWIAKRLANMADGGYGTIGQQLEMIGEQGMDAFKSHIAKVKQDIPKENK